MSEEKNIDRFVKDPSLLIELCREVIDEIDVSSDNAEIHERETQLREISKTIDRMVKAGVSVPDVLRSEKTRLVAAVSVQSDASHTLNMLADEFDNILKDLRKGQIGQSQDAGVLKPRGKRSRSPKTNKKMIREYIINALKKFKGRAPVSEIIEEIGRQMDGKFLPGDTEWREATAQYIWQNNAKWERFRMTKEGILRSDSPRGIWELTEEHK